MGAQSRQAPVIAQDQSAGGSDSQISGKSQGKNQQKKRQDIQKTAPAPASGLMAYSEVICYNCGEPGHHLDKCVKPKSCFICKMVTHKVENCPVRRKTHSSARYVGSAAPGLGFYHIDPPDENAQYHGSLKNVGIVLVEAGEVTKQELATEFADIYKTNWPWPINALDEWTFLVKFPPEIDVVQVAGYPCFGLKKDNVVVNVEVWKGRIEAEEDLQETWIKIRKLNPQVV